ncbi:hypothetical protein Moror_1646 [Moniliophthora roreri MCA 2997]|uniref:Uncharacterized protein n=1 Tax=Moniliophthora roreri (strain MCA 2997) TaxID=1381753 RepID=V2X307_MONRO|nr:hypothetical protein Moror_1646 [Moniliophthora roreri MCA 2997]
MSYDAGTQNTVPLICRALRVNCVQNEPRSSIKHISSTLLRMSRFREVVFRGNVRFVYPWRTIQKYEIDGCDGSWSDLGTGLGF